MFSCERKRDETNVQERKEIRSRGRESNEKKKHKQDKDKDREADQKRKRDRERERERACVCLSLAKPNKVDLKMETQPQDLKSTHGCPSSANTKILKL